MSDLKQKYPNLISKLNDEVDELRYLIVVDENYEDINDEESDVFDPADYNYLVYITELVSDVIGKEGLVELYTFIENQNLFDTFLASEEDLYGIKTSLNESEISYKILDIVENIVKEKK